MNKSFYKTLSEYYGVTETFAALGVLSAISAAVGKGARIDSGNGYGRLGCNLHVAYGCQPGSNAGRAIDGLFNFLIQGQANVLRCYSPEKRRAAEQEAQKLNAETFRVFRTPGITQAHIDTLTDCMTRQDASLKKWLITTASTSKQFAEICGDAHGDALMILTRDTTFLDTVISGGAAESGLTRSLLESGLSGLPTQLAAEGKTPGLILHPLQLSVLTICNSHDLKLSLSHPGF